MADGGFMAGLGGFFAGRRKSAPPMQEAGRSGTAVWGGYVESNERDPRLVGQNRYKTSTDLLVNVSIIAAGARYYLNLASAPKWKVEPAKDQADGKSSDAAKQAAEFVEDVLHDMDTNFSRVVRRAALYRFHGFGIQEWTAKRRAIDSKIGLLDIESRPQHTIERWDVDPAGSVIGVEQRSPQTNETLYIPRKKFLYLVDDSLTDSPEGLGLFRQLVERGTKWKALEELEAIGFDRDLRGVPIGRAPLAELNKLVKDGSITAAERDARLKGFRNFLKTQSKQRTTNLLVDSSMYAGSTADGTTVSAAPKWAFELATTGSTGHDDLGKAIERVVRDMALIMGVEGLLLGGTGGSGNRALGEDKSRNLYISVNQCVEDMAQAMGRDVVSALWLLNGLDEAIKPKLKPEDASFKDAASVAATLRDMATAGAVLAPDDPAIDDVRDLLGVSRQPAEAVERAVEAALMEHETAAHGVDQAGIQTEAAQVGLQQSKKDLKAPPPKPGAPK